MWSADNKTASINKNVTLLTPLCRDPMLFPTSHVERNTNNKRNSKWFTVSSSIVALGRVVLLAEVA